MPLACCPIISPSVVWLGGFHSHAVQYVERICIALERGTTAHYALRSRNSQRVELHAAPLTRREIFGGIGMHSKPQPNIRRRTMHSIEGAFVWYGFRCHFGIVLYAAVKLYLTAEL